jgi:hypothetical protein
MAINQGSFGTCVPHALTTIIADQLLRRYSVGIDANVHVEAIIMAMGNKFDGTSPVDAIATFNTTVHDAGYHFVNMEKDKRYKVWSVSHDGYSLR